MADHGFARAVTWRLAAIEARPPHPGDAALLAALAEEARRDLAPYVPAETLRAVEARCRAAKERTMYTRNEIVTGDARELAASIPDGSVDLVFTDPIYDRRDLYDWLGATARRVLRPGGAVLCWSNGKWHRENTNWLEAAGLRYRYDFACVIATGGAPMNGRIISKTNRLIWLDADGASRMRGYLADGYASVPWSRLHSQWTWTKNPVFSAQAMTALIGPGALVYDPFCGEGTFPAVCRAQGYDFIASEINPATAERARERLAATTPPLPGIYAEQAPLDLGEAA